jgi:hypothetical protein
LGVREQDGVGYAQLLGVPGYGVVSNLGVVGNAYNLEAIACVLFAELLQPGHLDLAGRAVGAPVVDQQWVALEVAQ